MYKAKINFIWYSKGDIISDEDLERYKDIWLKKEYIESSSSEKKKEEPSLDLNGDGKIDKEDAKIASKVMNKVKKSSKKKGKKK